jgi:negative regulator of flagellin synthesis FlgM
MKIGSIESKPVATPASERKPVPAPAPASTTAEPSAKVELSSTAAQLGGAHTEASFDSAKVDRISQAIRDGKFQVNPEAIADKLIVNAQELLCRKPS